MKYEKTQVLVSNHSILKTYELLCNASDNQYRIIRTLISAGSGYKIEYKTSTGSWLLYNSFLPNLTVYLSEDGERTNISLKFTPKKFIFIFTTLYMCGLLAYEIMLLWLLYTSGLAVKWAIVIPVLMALFCWGLNVIGFEVSVHNTVEFFASKIS